jgi:hypothetical protein
MRTTGLALLLASLALPVLADDLPKTIAGDIDGDGKADRIELRANTRNQDMVDVVVTLSASHRTVRVFELTAAQVVRKPVITHQGELQLAFGWHQGRYKSATDFHIGLQGNELVVRRYRTAVADTGSKDKDGGIPTKVCIADFIANRTTIDDIPATPPGPPVAFAAWTHAESIPAACRSLF